MLRHPLPPKPASRPTSNPSSLPWHRRKPASLRVVKVARRYIRRLTGDVESWVMGGGHILRLIDFADFANLSSFKREHIDFWRAKYGYPDEKFPL